MEEIWVPITEVDNRYLISNLGRCFSLKSRKIIKPNYNHNIRGVERNPKGYQFYSFIIKGKRKPYYVHRLVAEYFIDNPKSLPYVNHIDGNKSNNVVTNLEWCTPSQNIRHAYDNGFIDNEKRMKLIAIIDPKTGQEIKRIKGTKNVAKFLNCSKPNVKGALLNKKGQLRCCGYLLKYVD